MSRHCNLHPPGAAVRRLANAPFAALALAACGVASGQSLTPGSSIATPGTSLAASPHLAGTSPIPDEVRAFSHDGFATSGGLDGGLSASFGTAVPAVPEPSASSLLTLCLGSGAFGAWARRRAPLQWRLRGK